MRRTAAPTSVKPIPSLSRAGFLQPVAQRRPRRVDFLNADEVVLSVELDLFAAPSSGQPWAAHHQPAVPGALRRRDYESLWRGAFAVRRATDLFEEKGARIKFGCVERFGERDRRLADVR